MSTFAYPLNKTDALNSPLRGRLSENNATKPYTQRNIFEILLNEPEIRLLLPFSD